MSAKRLFLLLMAALLLMALFAPAWRERTQEAALELLDPKNTYIQYVEALGRGRWETKTGVEVFPEWRGLEP